MNKYSCFLEHILKDEALMIDLLLKWVPINSGSYNVEGLELIREVLAKDFSILPGKMETVQLSDRAVNTAKALRITCRPEAPMQILFNGHMDTVYEKNHPFQECKQINMNILQGPGVADMKGGLVVMLEVLKVFELTPWAKNVGWEILIVPDEEIGSPGSAHLLEAAAKRHMLGLIFEPSLPDGSLVRSRKGTGVYTAIAHGKEGHAGRHFNSDDNAIVGLSNFILKVNELNKKIPGAIFNVGYIEGGGPVNVIPGRASAKINVRCTTSEDQKLIEVELSELTKSVNIKQKVQIELEGHFTRVPKPASRTTDLLFKEFESCARDLGITLGWKDSGGASDGNNLAAAGLLNIDNLGVEGDNIHSEEEYVILKSLVKRAQLTALFLMKLASGEISLPN